MDDFNSHDESMIQQPKRKSHGTFWTLLLAALIALLCGYLGSYLANLQPEEKVVLQKVAASDSEGNVTPARKFPAEREAASLSARTGTF